MSSSRDGLQNERESLNERLEEARKQGDTGKETYLEGRIERVENEIDNKDYYDSRYKKD